jgi:hypothetical protein
MPSTATVLQPARTGIGRMLHYRLASRPFHLNRVRSTHLLNERQNEITL